MGKWIGRNNNYFTKNIYPKFEFPLIKLLMDIINFILIRETSNTRNHHLNSPKYETPTNHAFYLADNSYLQVFKSSLNRGIHFQTHQFCAQPRSDQWTKFLNAAL